jgi:hypothetical protein
VLWNSDRDLPSLEWRKAHMASQSVVATVIRIGCSPPLRRPMASTKPTVRAMAVGGSSPSPYVSAR